MHQYQPNYRITAINVEKVASIHQAVRSIVPSTDGEKVSNWVEYANTQQKAMAYVPSFLEISSAPTVQATPVNGWDSVRLNFSFILIAEYDNGDTTTWHVQGYTDVPEYIISNSNVLLPPELNITLNETKAYTTLGPHTLIANSDVLLTHPSTNVMSDQITACTPNTVFETLNLDGLLQETNNYADHGTGTQMINGGSVITTHNPICSAKGNSNPNEFANTTYTYFTEARDLTSGNTGLTDSTPYGVAATTVGSSSVVENPIVRWLTNNEYGGIMVTWQDILNIAPNYQDIIRFNQFEPTIGATNYEVGDWNATDLVTIRAAEIAEGINFAMSKAGLYYTSLTITPDNQLNPMILPNNDNAYKGFVQDIYQAMSTFDTLFKRTWNNLCRPYGPTGPASYITVNFTFIDHGTSELTVTVDNSAPRWFQIANWGTGLIHSSKTTYDTHRDVSDMTRYVLDQIQ